MLLKKDLFFFFFRVSHLFSHFQSAFPVQTQIEGEKKVSLHRLVPGPLTLMDIGRYAANRYRAIFSQVRRRLKRGGGSNELRRTLLDPPLCVVYKK